MSWDVRSEATVRGRVAATLESHSVSRAEQLLWLIVVSSMVLDSTLTIHAISQGMHELNPVARDMFDWFGAAGLISLKLSAVGVAVGLRGLMPGSQTEILPATLAVPWIAASTFNAVLMFGS